MVISHCSILEYGPTKHLCWCHDRIYQQAFSNIEHEDSSCKISEDQLFYLQSRGIGFEEAISMMVSGFCRDVFNQLPMEFAAEADKLLALKLEGSVG